MRVNVQSFLFSVLILVSFFPWVSFRANGMDTQPWAILVAALFVFSPLLKINKNSLWILSALIVVVSIAIFSNQEDIFSLLRSTLNYFFLLFLFFIFYNLFQKYEIPLNLIYYTNCVYLIFAIAQIVFGDPLVNFFAPIRTTENRGFSSLAVEPSYFGLVLMMYNILYLKIRNYKLQSVALALFIINILFIFFVSQSSITILYLMLMAFLFFIYKVNLKFFIFSSVLAISSFFLFEYFFIDSRVYRVFSFIITDGPLLLIYNDASVNYRVSSIIYPLHGMLNNGFLPGGFSSYKETVTFLNSFYNDFFWYGGHNKIHSYLGTLFYELGFVGIIMTLCYFLKYNNNTKVRYFESIFLFAFLLSSLPLASPLIALFLVMLLYLNRVTVNQTTNNI